MDDVDEVVIIEEASELLRFDELFEKAIVYSIYFCRCLLSLRVTENVPTTSS